MAAIFDNATSGSALAATSLVVNTPSCALGNRLVVGIGFPFNVITTPSGWTELLTGGGSASVGLKYFTRKATGTEAATYTWSWAAAANVGYVAGCWKSLTYPDDGWDSLDLATELGGPFSGAGVVGKTATTEMLAPDFAYSKDLLYVPIAAHHETNGAAVGHLTLGFLTERAFQPYGAAGDFAITLLDEGENPYFWKRNTHALYTPAPANVASLSMKRNFESTVSPPRPEGNSAWAWFGAEGSGWGPMAG